MPTSTSSNAFGSLTTATTSVASSGFPVGSTSITPTSSTGFAMGAASNTPVASLGAAGGYTSAPAFSANTHPNLGQSAFGTSAQPTPGQSTFGTTNQSSGFQFGTSVTTAGTTPFSTSEFAFGVPKPSVTSDSAPAQFQPPSSLSTSSALPFGISAAGTAAAVTNNTSAPINFSVGNATLSKSEASSGTTPSFTLNKPVTSIASLPSLASTQGNTASVLSTSLPSSSSAPALSFATGTSAPAAVTATSASFAFPGLKSTTSSTTAAPSMFGATATLSSASSVSSAITSAVLSTTTTVSASTASATTINFRQLEDTINKWKIELEEQEKLFLNQATQVNAWDRLLISNGGKITVLNDAVERVKLDQQRLDLELDFIFAQQSELEDLLSPLEKSIESTPSIHVQQHADLEREHTYHLAESIDAQLKRMSEDIREIIEHVNTANKAQDDNDPVQQIAKILNAHMDALQWIDQNSVALQRRLEGVSKLYESQKRESEKTFRGTY